MLSVQIVETVPDGGSERRCDRTLSTGNSRALQCRVTTDDSIFREVSLQKLKKPWRTVTLETQLWGRYRCLRQRSSPIE